MRVRPRTVLKWLGIALLGYAGAVALLYVIQRDLLYFPRRTAHTSPVAAGLPAAEEVVLATPDGERVITWHVPPQPGRSVILFFHGAGDVLARRAPRFRTLVAGGTGLVALSYRGYGGSTGLPSEHGVLLDAATAYEFAAARYAPERIVVWGTSLGTGPAVAIAGERPIGKLILEAPYTYGRCRCVVPADRAGADADEGSVPLGQAHRPGDGAAAGTACRRDWTVAIRFGERLFALAREPKRMLLNSPRAAIRTSTRTAQSRQRCASSTNKEKSPGGKRRRRHKGRPYRIPDQVAHYRGAARVGRGDPLVAPVVAHRHAPAAAATARAPVDGRAVGRETAAPRGSSRATPPP